MSHIIDDFMFVGPPNSKICKSYLDAFFRLSKAIGIPLKHQKTVLPSTCVSVHGIEIDTINMEIRLPGDKLFI